MGVDTRQARRPPDGKIFLVIGDVAVADPGGGGGGGGARSTRPSLKLDKLCFFNPIFLSECLKIRLR